MQEWRFLKERKTLLVYSFVCRMPVVALGSADTDSYVVDATGEWLSVGLEEKTRQTACLSSEIAPDAGALPLV
jgi:hypothetical protein